jgi:replicative DNA helicase
MDEQIKMPACPEIENQILASFMNDRAVFLGFSAQITELMFYQDWCKKVFAYMVKTQTVDFVMLCEVFPQYTDTIVQCVNETASHVSLVSYIDTLKDRYFRRCAIQAAEVMSQSAQTDFEVTPSDILGTMQESIMNIFRDDSHQPEHISTILPRAMDELEQAINKSTDGVVSGLVDVDNVLGSFVKNELTIIAARTSMGKSTLALNIARHNAFKQNIPVLLFALEMSSENTSNRMIFSEADSSYEKARQGVEDSLEQIQPFINPILSSPLWIDDNETNTIGQILIKAEQYVNLHGVRLVIIDHLQFVRSSVHYKSKVELYDDITRDLCSMAKRLNIPVICVSHLSRACESRTPPRPMLSDLRESGGIEQNADVVIFIYRDEYYTKSECKCPGTAEIIIAKNRNGKVGKVNVAWDGNTMQFRNLVKKYDESYSSGF